MAEEHCTATSYVHMPYALEPAYIRRREDASGRPDRPGSPQRGCPYPRVLCGRSPALEDGLPLSFRLGTTPTFCYPLEHITVAWLRRAPAAPRYPLHVRQLIEQAGLVR
jgi:hypothetical protein